jgi:cellulose synthase operon protein C
LASNKCVLGLLMNGNWPNQLLAAVSLFVASAVFSRVSAQTAEYANPIDGLQKTLAARAARSGTSSKGIIPLLELWRNWDRSTPATTFRLLQDLSNDKRISPSRRILVRGWLAEAKTRLGDLDAISRDFDELGYVRPWRVIGPFSNEGKAGLETDFGPESKADQPTDLGAQYPGRERKVKWSTYPDVSRGGYISLDALFYPNENVCALAESSIFAPKPVALTLWVGAGGAVKVYWNGSRVLVDSAYRQPSRERSAVAVRARQGLNRLLVKVCITAGRWGFYLRVGDERGDVAKNLRYDAQPIGLSPEVVKDTPLLREVPTDLVELEKAAGAKSAPAQALEDLARYLFYTDADDPSERRAKQLASRAIDLQPTVARYALAARLSEQRGEVLGFAGRAYQLAPSDAEATLLQASAMAGGPEPEAALPLIKAIPARSEQSFEARALEATILRALEMRQSAYQAVEAAQSSAPGAPVALRALIDASENASRQDRAMQLRRQLLAIRADDIETRRALVDAALDRAEVSDVLEQAENLRKLMPANTALLRYLGAVYEAVERDDLALTTYRRVTELAPENPAGWVAYGQALLRADYQRGALEAFRKALVFRPQDAETRELVEQLQKVKPEQRHDETYALSSRQVLAARRSVTGYPATILQDLTVKTVFENGLGSSFHQVAIQVHDKEGTHQWQSYSIQYDPDSQRVDLRLARIYRADGRILESVQSVEEQLGEPWYRIYYDTRALVAVFPNLEPGDTIELKYRIDDVAHRNLYADYFGDLQTLQRTIPVLASRYLLITPISRSFYFHQPTWKGFEHRQEIQGKRRIDSFSVRNVPALAVEPDMPGTTELSPYLHVSTYRSWAEVGRWYWGLTKDQLYADDALKQLVHQLTADAPDRLTKLRRLHHWVVRHIRYVALEFGIHGFLPYRVPLIVQRGFGDCKDKASLLYTMAREAGIEARITLVRTRHNGAIDEQPASLAVFDHAIVYVPEFDRYLDPTAEHNGIAELPVEDQGVMVLRVGPQGAELHRTPVLGPEVNRRTRILQVRLSADGSAQLDGDERVAGTNAARYRDQYQAPGTRRERLERSLSSDYPGAELVSESFEALDDLDQPVHFAYRARVPQLARWDGAELRLAPCSLHDLVASLASTAGRKFTLDLQGTSSYVEERTVSIPSGFRALSPPPGGEATSEFGRLRIAVQLSGHKLTTQTEFELKSDRITAQQYPDFRRWVEAADALLRQPIVLERGAP